MSWLSDFQDLVDLVEEEGWRVVTKSRGVWSIYPPERGAEIIHCNASADVRSLDNFKARLRRAGFAPLQRTKHMAKENPAPKPAPTPPPVAGRDLIAEARAHISSIMESLSALDTVLGEIAKDADSVAKVKALLQQLTKD